MNEIAAKLSRIGIIPSIKFNDVTEAQKAFKIFHGNGIGVVQIDFSAEFTKETVEQLIKAYPDIIIGAGTILNIKQAAAAIDAGALFITSNGLNEEVVRYCLSRGTFVIPGISSPTEIETALALGVDILKFTPAAQCGGFEMIKVLSLMYPQVSFIPSGSITKDNMNSYLAIPKVIAVNIGFAINPDYEAALLEVRSYVDKMLDFSLRHIGMNCADEEVATETSEKLLNSFSFGRRDAGVSYFMAESFELMKAIGRGTYGHIAIATPDVDRAVYYLEHRGVKFDYTTVKYDKDNKLFFVYLEDEIAGFAYHLVRYIK